MTRRTERSAVGLLHWLDIIPLWALVTAALMLGLAPFIPEPHLWEKLKMLATGTLTQPIDMFDLAMHTTLPLLLVVRLIRDGSKAKNSQPPA